MRRWNLCDFSDAYISFFNSHRYVVIAEAIHHIEKKKVAVASFAWPPDTLLQPNDIGIPISCRKYR